MIYDLKPFEDLVEQGYIRKCISGPLVLYTYTDKCTYDKLWNAHTRASRGIILDSISGELIAACMPKFFNLGEMEETFLCNLPGDYIAYEKYDGSMGTVYHYGGKWNVATKGSFTSEQAIKASQILNNYDLSLIPEHYTLVTEIIYSDNKIVVNYGEQEDLVLLTAYNRTTGVELHHDIVKNIAYTIGMPLAKCFLSMTLGDAIKLQNTLPKDKEGFVFKFYNGLRCKIKGDEYMKIHKMISNMSPISFWETMQNGVVNKEYLIQLPEEFRSEFEPMVERLEYLYKDTKNSIYKEIKDHKLLNESATWRRDVGIYLKNNNVNHSSAIFPILLNNNEAVDKYIMKFIRPTGNVLDIIN